jgi:2-oxoisovalerate dehydrogenase E1 component alpha subunit
VHELPVLFIVENNKYAISVPLHRQMNVTHVADRAAGYGMPGVTVDGTDVLASYAALSEATIRAVRGGGPTLVELIVERYLPHTSDDDDSVYRDRAEIDEARKHDPLGKLRALLEGEGLLTAERADDLLRAAQAEVDAATDAAEAAPFPPDDDVLERLFQELP